MASSVGTEFLLALSDDAAQDKTRADALLKLLSAALTGAGLLVSSDTQPGVKLPDGTKRFITVSAPRALIDLEGDHLCYLKPRTSDGKKMEFAVLDAATFANFDTAGFWLPCEEVQLLWSLIEHVELHGKGLAPLIEGLNDRRSKVVLEQSKTSIVKALQIAELLEVAAPLHRSAALQKIWRTSLFSIAAPVQDIQQYFGSKVAFYFAWMNFFTLWLTAPGAVGLAVYLHKVYYEYTVDNDPWIPFFSLFMVLWACMFVGWWRRASAEWACHWNTLGEDGDDEVRRPRRRARARSPPHIYEPRRAFPPDQMRAEFHGDAIIDSPVTGRPVRTYPVYKRYAAFLLSAVVTGTMLGVALLVMSLMLNLEGYIQDTTIWTERLFYVPMLAQLAAPGAIFDPLQTHYYGLVALVPTLLHVLTIQQLNKFYRSVATWLTENENHETARAHEDSLVLKRFFFEAFDTYIALFYLAFVQFDVRRLRTELVTIYTADSFRRLATESLIPTLSAKVMGWGKRKEMAELKRTASGDAKGDAAEAAGRLVNALEELDQEEYEQFDDYLEMVIEFGYVTLFASAFPLASCISVFCNLIEIKSDCYKLTHALQRPPAERVNSIGVWGGVLQVMMLLSIVTNASLFAFSSEQMAAWFPDLFRTVDLSPEAAAAAKIKAMTMGAETVDLDEQVAVKGAGRYVVLIAVAIEHALFIAAAVILVMVPAIPSWVQSELQRRGFEKAKAAKEVRRQAIAAAGAHVKKAV